MATGYKWFGTDAKAPVAIVEDESLQVVRFQPGVDLLDRSGDDFAEAARVHLYLRGSGVLVVGAPRAGGVGALALGPSLDALFAIGQESSPAMLRENGLRFQATGVITHTTGRLYVRFAKPVGRAEAVQKLGELKAGGRIVDWTPRKRPGRQVFRLAARDVSVPALFKLANSLHERGDVEQCYPYLGVRGRVDGPCPREWHLRRGSVAWSGHMSSAQPDAVSSGLEAVAAWKYGRGFRYNYWWSWFFLWRWWFWRHRVVVAIIDQGIDTDHDAFSGWGKVVSPANFLGVGNANDARPQGDSENHGTPMAGLAVARGGRGAHGVAPDAALMPIRALDTAEDADDDTSADYEEEALASAFDHAREEGADVISCSWHWEGSTLPTDLEEAIDLALELGRDEKGCVVLFSAGNRVTGGLQSINDNPTASHPGVIAVGACTPGLDMSGYPPNVHPVTVGGTALWCLFPVAMDNFLPMYLVDRMGEEGRNSVASPAGDHYEDLIGSTSKACAGAAGVAALVLAANYELTTAKVKQIMADCCEKLPTDWGRPGEDSTVIAAGLPETFVYSSTSGRSDSHGHGRLNALRAVELAKGLCQITVIL